MTITGKPISDIILVLWFFSAVFDYLDFTYLWQLKEYRLDLFKDFLRTKQGSGFVRGYRIFWRSIFAMAVFTFLRDSFRYDMFTGLHIITLFILSVDLYYNANLYLHKKARRPVPTKKSLLIILATISIEAGIIMIFRQMNILLLLLVFRFVLISGVVLSVRYPTELMKLYYIKSATRKIKKYPKIRVIGITGSYGKSSVKNFLSHILAKKYKVIYTPKNINTEIGVAQFVLNTNLSDVDIFVCEMGAYKMGEIRAITDIVRPTIGIITAINEQHLSIFGSIENTQKAKFELVDSLPEDGLAILNKDNRYIREKINSINTNVKTYGIDDEFNPDCLITEVHSEGASLSSKYTYLDHSITLRVDHLYGEHNAQNLAACIVAAHFLSLTDEEIIEQAHSATLPSGTLNVFNIGESIIIDDSYNSNPDGFQAALYTLSEFKVNKPRIVITRGMQELGNRSEYLHERIGGEIAYTADELVIIQPDHATPLKLGVGNKYNTNIHEIFDFVALEAYIDRKIEAGCVILLENRLPPHIYKKIIQRCKDEINKK
jgi:UDP-N-acetylmuramoyl-tripeptide--D-alanyl-D-alanine ligase